MDLLRDLLNLYIVLIVGKTLELCLFEYFVDFLLLAHSYSNKFYQLYTFGTAIAYIFQTFLTIGGEVKFIPLTGVTLPLVSYGGSSILTTFIMFGIVSAIFMLQEERLERFRIRYEQERAFYSAAPVSSSEMKERVGEKDNGLYSGTTQEEQDFYKDFKGVPIYDPNADYENVDRFDV